MKMNLDIRQWGKWLGKYKFLLLLCLAGVILLLWPGTSTTKKSTESVQQEDFDLQAEEKRLAQLLEKIDGVGQVKVMLTLAASTEKVLAQDGSLSYSGSPAAPEEYKREQETVLVSQGSGNSGVVVRKTIYPTYRGALVVCSGGGSGTVRLAVTEAVAKVTGLGTDRISVCAWKEE